MDEAKKIARRTRKHARDERLRELLRELRVKHGSNAEVARQIGVESATITEALNTNRGVGLEVMIALADYTGRTLDDLAGRPPRPSGFCLASLPRWPSVRAEAEQRLAHMRPEVVSAALDKVALFTIPEPMIALTGLFIARLAEAVAANPADF